MKASTYPLVDAEDAARLVLERTPVLEAEKVGLGDCPGRVLAEDLVASRALPPFPSSAVDGYAIRSADGGGRLRVVGESAAGRPFDGPLPPGTAARILTGGVLPDGADTVVMLEDAEVVGSEVAVPEGYAAGRNFHRPGADLEAGELVLAAGEELGAAEIGLAASLGLAALTVRRRPRVALMSTGDELVEVGRTPGRGQITDSNRWALAAALDEAGVPPFATRGAE
jgi:molybdopterin molybdotransferase